MYETLLSLTKRTLAGVTYICSNAGVLQALYSPSHNTRFNLIANQLMRKP